MGLWESENNRNSVVAGKQGWAAGDRERRWYLNAGQCIGARGSVQAELAVELVAAVVCHRMPGINRLRE